MLTFITAAVLLAIQPAAPATPDAAPDTPPIILTIGGQPHQLHDGRTVTITIDGKPHAVRIDLPTVTRFSGTQISFDFPATLTGGLLQQKDTVTIHRYADGNASLLIFECTEPIPFATIFNDLVAEYGDAVDENSVADTVLEAKIAKLNGRSITINLAGQTLRQEVYRIANAQAATFILLQDIRDDPNQPTEAFTTLRTHLAQTLKTK